jgi:4'-phosphopantetheinyl transferase
MNIYTHICEKPLDKSQQRELALGLLEYALEKEFNVKACDLGGIVYARHGKPYFKNSDIFFNYSHCKYAAVCAVALEEVGVDVQEIKTVKPSVIKRVCCDNELRVIKTDEDFIKTWVLKEAYAKFTAKGICMGLQSIDTTMLPDELVINQGDLYIACYSRRLNEFPTSLTLQSVLISPP